MKLGKIVEEYIKEHNISQRKFAQKCGLSSGYISMIVNGINPRSKTPIIPTLKTLQGIADGMNISLDTLISQMDDTLIKISNEKQNVKIKEFTRLFLQLSEEQQALIIASIKGILANNK